MPSKGNNWTYFAIPNKKLQNKLEFIWNLNNLSKLLENANIVFILATYSDEIKGVYYQVYQYMMSLIQLFAM